MEQVTPDMYFASALICVGIKPSRIEGSKYMPKIWFKVTKKYKEATVKYFRGELLIDPLAYKEVIKNMKGELRVMGELEQMEITT